MLGTFILWFGWYGFNSGSALIAPSLERGKLVALSAVNTTLSGGMAGLVALFVNLFILERQYGEPIFDLRMAMNGSLSGLVAITAGCGVGELILLQNARLECDYTMWLAFAHRVAWITNEIFIVIFS